jgi:microcin C transport system substrate-binding protein
MRIINAIQNISKAAVSLVLVVAAASAIQFLSSSSMAAKKAVKTAAQPGSTPPKTYGSPNAKTGGTFTINLDEEPTTLNPITATDLYSFNVMAYIIDGLMDTDPETHELIPALAEKVDVAPDGKSMTFTLRKGATFHDGHPVTVEDVKFSYEVIFDPTYNVLNRQPYFENFERKAEIIGTDQVKFNIKTPYFGNLEQIASLGIVPKSVYGNAAEGKKKNKTMVGSGPYKIEKYDQGQSILLVKNKDWWGNKVDFRKGQYNFEHIRMRFIKDENIAIESIKKGDTDYQELRPEAFMKKTDGPEWGKTVQKFKTDNLAPKSYGYIGWNLKKDIFKDKKVRLALYMLMNREDMNKKFRFGMSYLATGPWYQQSEYADPKIKAVQFDPKKAVELLKQAGWTDSDKNGILDRTVNGKKEELSFTLIYGNKDTEKYWVLFQSDLKKVGVDMKLQLLEWNAMLKNIDESNFDAIAMAWGAGSVDIDPKQIWHTSSIGKGGSNFISYSNPEVDKMIDEARLELNKRKRIPLLRKIYAKIADDVPYAFLFNDRYVLYSATSRMKMVKPTMKYEIGTGYWWVEDGK